MIENIKSILSGPPGNEGLKPLEALAKNILKSEPKKSQLNKSFQELCRSLNPKNINSLAEFFTE